MTEWEELVSHQEHIAKLAKEFYDKCEGDQLSYIAGFQRGEKESKIAPIKSPFTGGIVVIKSEKETAKFRNEEVVINRKFYICEDTGRKFTDSKLDDDMMWDIFRAYWEKRGFSRFSDIDGGK